nr:DUF4105 domain-containing protein [uncultured Halomonas sp.]
MDSMAGETSLADTEQWRSLLHFDRDGLFKEPRSAVIDSRFFLAPNGATDPAAELEATLNAFRADPTGMEPGTHALCRFPARALWITQATGEQWPQNAACPDLGAWQERYEDASVGLIFASGYLGNPASFFGHLMIHLQPPAEPGNLVDATQLLDTSLNFGADVPATDGLAKYMAKGLLGGYEAKFSNAPFYRNTTIYSEKEMRDLWHYELALPDEERQLLIAHLYEILGQDYDYLFLTQNCASRIARTLEVVIDADLTVGSVAWVAPESVIRNVGTAYDSGQPLLKTVHHVPSRRLITEQRYRALNNAEQTAARRVLLEMDRLDLTRPEYLALSPKRRAAVIETLQSHVALLRDTQPQGALSDIARRLQLERLSLPRGQQSQNTQKSIPIHEATPSSTVRAQGVYNNVLGDGLRLTIRPLHYDLLDSEATRMPNAALEIGTTKIDLGYGSPKLREFKLFSITNLYTQHAPLPASPTMAWHASAGIARSTLDCDDCLDGNAKLLAGKSSQIGSHIPFALVGGQLRTQRYNDGALAPMAQAGLLSHWTERQRTLLTIEHADALQGESSRSTEWNIQYRVALNNYLDIRVEAQGDGDARELAAGMSFYF